MGSGQKREEVDGHRLPLLLSCVKFDNKWYYHIRILRFVIGFVIVGFFRQQHGQGHTPQGTQR